MAETQTITPDDRFLEDLAQQANELSSQAGMHRLLGPGQQSVLSPALPPEDMAGIAVTVNSTLQHGSGRLYLVDLRTVKQTDDGYKSVSGRKFAADTEYVLTDLNPDFEGGLGYKELRKGDSYVYMQPAHVDSVVQYRSGRKLSSKETMEIRIDDERTVTIGNVGSGSMFISEALSGTRLLKQGVRSVGHRVMAAAAVREPRTERLTQEPDYANSRSMSPHELWVVEDNDDRTFSDSYIEHYGKVRNILVDEFESGRLYRSTDDFTKILKNIHRYLGETGDYNRLNDKKLDADRFGNFRGPGRPTNGRLQESRMVTDTAHDYGDEYNLSRLQQGAPNSTSKLVVRLPHISPNNMPYDVVQYGVSGRLNGYQYVYPEGAGGLDEYMSQIVALGRRIDMAIKQGTFKQDEVVSLVGRQYQYGACARPFDNINNSIFMQIANMQVKLLGLKGVTHSNMDIAAQRMQPNNFSRYFTDRVLGRKA